MAGSEQFLGYHSEWNLGSPGGWDYQRITQEIGKAVWEKLFAHTSAHIDVNFDHPMLFPVNGLVDLMRDAHRRREGSSPGLIAVVVEEETLDDVVENQNLALALDRIGRDPELAKIFGNNGHQRISTDFNTDTTVQQTLELYQELTDEIEALEANLDDAVGDLEEDEFGALFRMPEPDLDSMDSPSQP